jgi:hypothetical protein
MKLFLNDNPSLQAFWQLPANKVLKNEVDFPNWHLKIMMTSKKRINNGLNHQIQRLYKKAGSKMNSYRFHLKRLNLK